MRMDVLRTGTLATALCVVVAALAAQQPPAAPVAPAGQPAVQQPAAQPARSGQAALEKGLVGALVERPDLLHLTASQLTRTRQLSKWLDERNAPLHAQLMQATGGRAMRDIPPAERRQIGQQVRPLMQQMLANDRVATDSLRMVLTPDQNAQIDSLAARVRAGAAGGPRGPGRDSVPPGQQQRRPRRP